MNIYRETTMYQWLCDYDDVILKSILFMLSHLISVSTSLDSDYYLHVTNEKKWAQMRNYLPKATLLVNGWAGDPQKSEQL